MRSPRTCTDGIGLVVALPAEAHSLGARGLRPGDCRRWRRGWIAVAGVGPFHALRAAERLLACGVTQLASWGIAGALDPGLAPGDVLIPDRILYADGDAGFATHAATTACLGMTLGPHLHVRSGALWSSDHAIATAADKRALASRSGALAVDMEAASVAAVAARAQLPFTGLKVICDPANRELPAALLQAIDTGGRLSWRMLSAIVAGGPVTWRATHLLARDFASARRALTAAAALAA